MSTLFSHSFRAIVLKYIFCQTSLFVRWRARVRVNNHSTAGLIARSVSVLRGCAKNVVWRVARDKGSTCTLGPCMHASIHCFTRKLISSIASEQSRHIVAHCLPWSSSGPVHTANHKESACSRSMCVCAVDRMLAAGWRRRLNQRRDHDAHRNRCPPRVR